MIEGQTGDYDGGGYYFLNVHLAVVGRDKNTSILCTFDTYKLWLLFPCLLSNRNF